MTREIGKEVPEVCTYAEAMVLKGIRQGIEEGIEKGISQEIENTVREKKRADEAEARIRELEAQLAEAKKK